MGTPAEDLGGRFFVYHAAMPAVKIRKSDLPKPPGAGSIVDVLRSQVRSKARTSMADVSLEVIRLAGGKDNFAKLLWEEYLAADLGSIARQRLFQLWSHGLNKIKDDYSAGDLDDLDDHDITAVFRHYAVEAGVISNAGPDQPCPRCGFARGRAADDKAGEEAEDQGADPPF
jgi:hypothetical protein